MCWKLKAQKTNKQSLPVVINASGGEINSVKEKKKQKKHDVCVVPSPGMCLWKVRVLVTGA